MKKINFKKINSLLFSLIIVFSFLGFTKEVFADLCPNIRGEQSSIPPGHVIDSSGNCVTAKGATANPQGTYNDEPYQPLAPLPGYENIPGYKENGGFTFGPTKDNPDAGKCPLGEFMNIFIDIFIGIVAILSMVMIVMGGIEYVMSDLVTSKEEAKSRIQNAILGLILSLPIYIILNTVNPNLLNLCLDIKKVSVTIEELQIQGRLGNGKCEQAQSGPCSASNLTAFGGQASKASAICNGESGNGTHLASALDKGSDGNPFSFGLFQINIIAHGSQIGDGQICKNIFKVNPNPPGKVGNSVNDSTLGGCLERKNGICVKYAATVIDQNRYNACKNFISKTDENIKYAAKLQQKSGWGQWGFNSSCGF